MAENKMFRLNVAAERGVVLNGVLFRPEQQKTADTVMISITGIHGNFYSNPFYYNIGDRGARSFKQLTELFAGNGMIGYVAKERVDGILVLPEAVQILKIEE